MDLKERRDIMMMQLSVQILVEEMKMSESNPTILYKPQGMPQPEACENMCNNDFMLVIQTQLQAEIIKKYSYDRVILYR